MATTRQLKELGFSENGIRRMVRRGVLVVQRKGVYATSALVARAAREVPRMRALQLAAVLAKSEAVCVGSHWTAAAIHGLDLLAEAPADVVALTQAAGGTGSRAPRRGIRLHIAELPPADVVKRHGVPVTSVARTVVDLARAGTFREGVVVADSALSAGKTTRAGLEAVLAGCAHWPGLQQAKSVVAFSDERSESVLESAARVIMHERGLPPPELQVWICDGYGARIGRVDFFWPRYSTIGEADGAVKYEDPATARKQLTRDKKLRQAGYELVHFSWPGIFYQTDSVIAELRAAFRRGQA